ncbi:MAG: PAS domain-containing protein [Spirulinaceae cyanobacterium]
MTTQADILVVDDNPTNLRLLSQMLTQAGYHARPTTNGKMALSAARVVVPDLILLDIMMPDLNGYEVCERLKADPQTRDIPVIFISALETAMDKVRAFSVGGVDYIEKPFQMVEVLARIENQLRLRSARQQLQRQNTALAYFSACLKQLNRLNTTTYENFEQLCQDYLRTGCEMLGFSVGAIATATNPPAILAVESTLPQSPSELQTTLQNAASLYQQTITQGQTLAIAQASPEYSTYLGTPIWVNSSPYGTLNFFTTKDRSPGFNAHESEIIELMAQGLGKYIETRQREELRQQAEEETQLLLRVTQAIGEAPDFTTALQVALTQVATSCGWHYGEAWIPSVDSQYLECASAWYGIPDSGTAQTPLIQELREFSVQLHFEPGQGLPGRVWAKAKPEYLDAVALKADGDFKRRAWIKSLGIQNALSVPIMRHQAPTDEWQQQNRVLAVLVFLMFDLPPRQHIADNERLAALVTAVATQLGTAIQQKQDRDVLRALFAAMDDWVTVWDRHGRCIQVAPTHQGLPQFGEAHLSLTAWIGKTLDDIFPADTACRIRDRIAQTLSRQERTQLEYCMILNQREVWFDARLSPLSPETILLTARDISDRKLIEQKLRTNEAELRGVFEAMSDIVLAIHPAEQSVRVMPTCYTHLDAQANEILNLTLNYLFNCEEHPEFLQAIQTAIATQKTVHFEYHLQLSQRKVWFDASISPITADAAIWVARDISDRAALQASLQQLAAELEQRVEQRTAQLREANQILQSEVSDRLQAQKKLARSTEQLQAVLDAVPGFVFWVGQGDRPHSRYAPNLRYLGVNHRFAKAFNLNTDAFINQPLGFIGQDVPLTQPIEQFLYSSTVAIAKTIELNLNRATRSYLLVAQKYHQNNAAVAIAVDITPRIQAEQQAKQAYQRLELISELTLKIRRSLDLDEILNTAMFEVKKLFDTERVALIQIETCYRYEIVKETLNAEIDSLERLCSTTPFPDPQAWESFNAGQCLTLTAALATRNSNMRSRLQQLGIYAELLVPIFIGENLWGAVAIHSVNRPRQWRNSEIELITALADQIGIALSQASLLNSLEERVNERTSQLQAANQKLQQEIRDRLLAELALRRSEMQLRLITDALPVLISYVDNQERYRFNNRTYSDWYGIPLEEITGRSLLEVFGETYYQTLCPHVGKALSGEKVSFEMHAPLINGQQRYISATYIPDWGAQNRVKGFFSVEIDISNRIAVEQMKDEFLSIASHELRTPLTSLRGSLGLLGTGRLGSLTDQGARMLEIAVKNTDRLVRLINDILDLQHIESGRLKTIKKQTSAVELLSQVADAMQSMAKQARVELVVRINGQLLEPTTPSFDLYVDPDRILQTLTNLISNAIKFSEAESTVDIEVQQQVETVLFWVRDRGRGIPADKMEMIFERFQQVDASDSRAKGGTGLGLAICRQIIKQHGGTIWVESEVDRGSTFFVSLPLVINN